MHRSHPGIFRARDPFQLLVRLDATLAQIDVGAWPHFDVVSAQVVGEDRGEISVDIDGLEAVPPADFFQHKGPRGVFATGVAHLVGDVELHRRTHLTDSRLLACPAFLQRARPQSRVCAAAVDDDHQI